MLWCQCHVMTAANPDIKVHPRAKVNQVESHVTQKRWHAGARPNYIILAFKTHCMSFGQSTGVAYCTLVIMHHPLTSTNHRIFWHWGKYMVISQCNFGGFRAWSCLHGWRCIRSREGCKIRIVWDRAVRRGSIHCTGYTVPAWCPSVCWYKIVFLENIVVVRMFSAKVIGTDRYATDEQR